MFACNSFLFMIFQRSFGIRSFQHGSARSAVRRTSKHLESFKGRHRLRTRWTGSYFFSFPSWFFCIRRSLLRIVSIFSSNWLEKDFNDGFFSVAAMYISSFLSFVFSFLLLSLIFESFVLSNLYVYNILYEYMYIDMYFIYIYIHICNWLDVQLIPNNKERRFIKAWRLFYHNFFLLFNTIFIFVDSDFINEIIILYFKSWSELFLIQHKFNDNIIN